MGVVDTVSWYLESARRIFRIRREMNRYLDEDSDMSSFLTVDDGRLWLAGGIDVVPSTDPMWGALIQALVGAHGPAVIKPIQDVYREVGSRHGKLLKYLFSPEQQGRIFDFYSDIGYANAPYLLAGTVEDLRRIEDVGTEIRDDDELIVAPIRNASETHGVKSIGLDLTFPCCIFEPCFAQGVFEQLLDRPVYMEEKRCEGKGDDYCLYVFGLGERGRQAVKAFTSLSEEVTFPEDAARDTVSPEQVDDMLRDYVSQHPSADEMLELGSDGLELMGVPTFPFLIEAWGSIITGLMDTLGQSAIRSGHDTYRELGIRHGTAVSDCSPEEYSRLITLWEHVGYYTIDEITVDGTSVTVQELLEHLDNETAPTFSIQITDSMTARGLREHRRTTVYPACIFESAYLEGVFAARHPRDISVTEKTCQARGDNHCTWQYHVTDD